MPSPLTDHFNRFEDIALVEVMERIREGPEWGQPYRCCQLTDAIRVLFDRNNLSEREAYRAMFAEVKKTGEIKAAEAVDRPDSPD